MKLQVIMMFCVLASALSCTTSSKQITNSEAYNVYLESSDTTALENAHAELNFWQQKLDKQPNQFPYLAKIASAYSQLFAITGDIKYLINAEASYLELNDITNQNNSGFLKGLAANYISQHKFKEALVLLNKAEANGDKLEGTQKMLFDVHLELGNYELAKGYLDAFSDDRDFDYLIRVAKWSDHRGNLDAAIKYLEKARDNAEFSNVPSTKQWVYTNLGDFYGHHGDIEASYNHFMKALELFPNDAYAKKGIAWIVYAHEKNPDEALRILNTVTKTYNAPDYYLLKAEIAEYKGDETMKNEQLALYKTAVKNAMYGDMYNAYNVVLYANTSENLDEALAIAQTEISNRPTPLSYDLLAWTYHKKGQTQQALEIMEQHVSGKTSEPKALYHLAEVYKANGKLKQAENLKADLLESIYELGPLMEVEINKI
ncbi:tetratricopeptide repeat protein [Mariniflexile sp. AS56]|uniref:tetratricopeptide repeat protein n=1 Tax=Mariniflexile sp. AS56 TaxID=3063957 RepID=UPI0026E9DE73|nr:cell surface protein [Mariniflexile sp. AS56]MDO7173936.1 cell surface protein [Mariniflexile sp. AS56]